MTYCYEYPRPAISVDIVVLRRRGDVLEVALIRRLRPPYEGCWALPGGFMDIDESVEAAAARELREETGLIAPSLKLIGPFSAVDRDPRGRVVSIAFVTVIDAQQIPRAGDDAAEVQWFAIGELPPLAFDHARILEAGLEVSRSLCGD